MRHDQGPCLGVVGGRRLVPCIERQRPVGRNGGDRARAAADLEAQPPRLVEEKGKPRLGARIPCRDQRLGAAGAQRRAEVHADAEALQHHRAGPVEDDAGADRRRLVAAFVGAVRRTGHRHQMHAGTVGMGDRRTDARDVEAVVRGKPAGRDLEVNDLARPHVPAVGIGERPFLDHRVQGHAIQYDRRAQRQGPAGQPLPAQPERRPHRIGVAGKVDAFVDPHRLAPAVIDDAEPVAAAVGLDDDMGVLDRLDAHDGQQALQDRAVRPGGIGEILLAGSKVIGIDSEHRGLRMAAQRDARYPSRPTGMGRAHATVRRLSRQPRSGRRAAGLHTPPPRQDAQTGTLCQAPSLPRYSAPPSR